MREDIGRIASRPGWRASPQAPRAGLDHPATIPCAGNFEVLAALDEWCKKRAARLNDRAGEHILSGRSLSAPNYRLLLGEHRAYMAMRSYIHGTLTKGLIAQGGQS